MISEQQDWSTCSGQMPIYNHGLEGFIEWPREAHIQQ